MTPERAAYHRFMLIAGMREEYEQELDLALETEDPITAPILDLACCLSNLDQTISTLNEYILNHPVDDQQVHDMIITKLRRLYENKQLDALAVCEALDKIQRTCNYGEPWIDLYTYLYAYELMDEGLISRTVFEIAFEAEFLRGEQLDVWKMNREMLKTVAK